MKMHSFLFLLLSFTLILTSCQKDENIDEDYAPADSSISKFLFDSLKDEVDQQISGQAQLNGLTDEIEVSPRGGCANINITPLGLTFPKQVTITFPAGCTTTAGAAIEGSITLHLSGRVKQAGSNAAFSISDFKYKGYTLTGDYDITFNGNNGHTTTIKNGTVVKPDGGTISYQATNTSTQIDGLNTTFFTNPFTFWQDDVFAITTVSAGTNSKGHAYTVTTETPLTYKVNCQWVVEGKIIVVEEGKNNITASIDYGDGSCDNKALLTFNNKSVEIILP